MVEPGPPWRARRRAVVDRVLAGLASRSRPGEPAVRATLVDVRACYRLLLGRQPDQVGLEHYRRRLAGGPLDVDTVVGEFLASEEFARRREDPSRYRPEVVLAPGDGFKIYADPHDWAVGSPVTRTGSYEPEVTATIKSVVRPGHTVVDIGANIGWFSLLAARLVGPSGRVIAVEPNPANSDLLQRSVEANGFTNVSVVTAALGARPGLAALETDASNGRMIPLSGDGAEAAALRCSYVVPVRRLDDVLAEVGVTGGIDVVKVDVEGAEPQALAGAPEALARRPVIVSELFPVALRDTSGVEAGAFLDSLRALGYEISVITGEGGGGAGGDISVTRVRPEENAAILARFAAGSLDHIDILARLSGGQL